MSSRKKILSISLAVIGVALLILGFYQINQYITTSAAFSKLGGLLSGLGSEAGALTGAIGDVSNSIILTIVLDFALGLILLVLGILLYPEQ